MRIVFYIFALSLLIISCGNKSREENFSSLIDDEMEKSYLQLDSAKKEDVNSLQKELTKPSTPTSAASSRTSKSNVYDNMRGFDPASEDDIEDNGMSRYMENNDEEGWD